MIEPKRLVKRTRMTALDFIMYCTGFGIVTISIGVALRLSSGTFQRRRKAEAPASNEQVWQSVPVTDPSGEGLAKRMLEFQTARYASPIMQRQLSDDAGPPQRSFSRPSQTVPGPIVPRIPAVKPQLRVIPTKAGPEKVVQFPQKMRKDDANKKED